MLNIADIIVVVIILVAISIGYKKGFIKTAFGVLSFFVAIAITFMFYKPVMVLLEEKTSIRDSLTGYFENTAIKYESAQSVSESGDKISENSGEVYIQNLPQTIVDLTGINEVKENAKTVVIKKIVDFIVKLLSILIVYIVAKIVLSIVVLVLDSIACLPVLKQFNELLGLGLGAVLGIIQVYSLCAILMLISSMPIASGITNVINDSLFAHNLYNNNLILEILF